MRAGERVCVYAYASNGPLLFLFFARLTVQMAAITNQVPIKYTFSWNVFFSIYVHCSLKVESTKFPIINFKFCLCLCEFFLFFASHFFFSRELEVTSIFANHSTQIDLLALSITVVNGNSNTTVQLKLNSISK